ncbi:MAG TPA: alkaline phosphatase [Planctomycetota bacterium]|nr:alkaline phosphatase [Planctomycetota bacterium]
MTFRHRIFIASLLFAAALALAEEEPRKTVIYPIDRATILAGSKFDFKVEFPQVIAESAASIRINGKNPEELFGKAPQFIAKEDTYNLNKDLDRDDPKLDDDDEVEIKVASAVILRDCILEKPGTYSVVASDGTHSATVTWEVYETPAKRSAKNVILMIGDGMSLAHRKAARALSKGIKEGRHGDALAMDSMPHMALLGTSGVDNFVTDSANSAHAYTTGHKSSNAALGVYADRTKSVFDDPKVETLAYLATRMNKMNIGIVTTSEVQDATPASMVAHTRSRGEKTAITEWHLQAAPKVLMGGGAGSFTSKTGIDKKKHDTDFLTQFTSAGYTLVKTADALDAAMKNEGTEKILGLFHTGNMDGVLDRKFLKKGTVEKFPQQPGLEEMTQAALTLLSRNNENGFVLMVESAMIDKFSHALDWERAVMDTIEFDKTVALVKEFAAKNGDTLVLVTSDHAHCISIGGVIDDNRKVNIRADLVTMKDKIGGGYPNYVDEDKDGYPDSLDVSKRLAIFFGAFGDHYETFRPKLDGPFKPSMLKRALPLQVTANEKYKDVPGAILREGNLGRMAGGGIHAADDVILTGIGPGSEEIRGFMENTQVFQVIARALSLGTRSQK